MSTTVITAADLLRWYAEDIAFVAEEQPAADLGDLATQLDTVASRFSEAGINGHEDLEDAGVLLNEAQNSDDETDRNVFLRRAEKLLNPVVSDMTDEYRLMVGD